MVAPPSDSKFMMSKEDRSNVLPPSSVKVRPVVESVKLIPNIWPLKCVTGVTRPKVSGSVTQPSLLPGAVGASNVKLSVSLPTTCVVVRFPDENTSVAPTTPDSNPKVDDGGLSTPA